MTREHLLITLCAGATWCLIVALALRGIFLMFDASILGAIDIGAAILAFFYHVKLERYEGYS